MSLCSPPPLLNWVLDRGADPNLHRDGMSHSVLEHAALRNYVEHAGTLIAKGAHVNNTNALRIAAYKGHIKMIEQLFEKGANINEIPRTALNEAAEEGQLGAVRLSFEKRCRSDFGGYYREDCSRPRSRAEPYGDCGGLGE
ncbi:hypothetical protein C0995_012303 [Termitomyces sp. Mi166|nr:hypothetical protein C0995_012303 [Termitomyces sp. Mi166\